jgi:NADH-quinone oxidoreductase subunit C
MSDAEDSKPDATPPAQSGGGGAEEKAPQAAGEAAAGASSETPPAEAAPEAPAEGEKPATEAAPAPPAEKPAPPSEEDEEAKKAAAAAAAKAKAEAAAKAKAAKAAAEAAKPPWERDPKVPQWEEAGDDPLAATLAAAHGDGLLEARSFAGDLVLDVAPPALFALAADLKENHGYTLLVDICGAHYPDREEGPFEVLYHLYSFDQNRRVRLKVKAGEDPEVPSVVGVWEGANWPEREAWDMYGIRFTDHPDMTRILMWEGFDGHPLRKEFPVEGVDTGAAIYPEYYDEQAGPVAGTGSGWKPAPPPEPPAPDEA